MSTRRSRTSWRRPGCSRSTTDKSAREKLIGDIQTAVAKDLSTLPLLQGAQVAVSGTDVKGVKDTLDASFKFRLGVLSK
jgi:peptide/nickel transport system substrate-binding protein